MVEYVGLFIEGSDATKLKQHEKSVLEKLPKNYHVTLEFRPKTEDKYNVIINKIYDIKVIGYGCDGENSGYLVELPEELKRYYNNLDQNNNLKPPHITMSMSRQGKAVNTANLDFEKIQPFKVRGVVKQVEREILQFKR